MAQNKSKAHGGATPQYDFPLHTYSLKPVMREVVMPILYPLLMSYGVIMLGWGGVGKTPLFIIMSMAMGRYHVRRLELDSPAGWRRAKSMDNFRHRAGKIQEGIFLDDPNRDTLHIEDLKSLMTVEEESTCEARYNDVKLAANSTRGCASNDLNAEDEPPADDRSVITSDEFFKLVSKFFCGERPASVLAVLKRSITMIFGQHGFYLRLPSKDRDAVVHRLTDFDVHLDVLSEDHKTFYGAFKSGDRSQKPPDFEADVEREQNMILAGVAKFASRGADAYIKKSNGELSAHFAKSPVFIPEAQADAGGEETAIVPLAADGTWMIPRCPAPPARSRKRSGFAVDFRVPSVPRRALKMKTTPEGASQSATGSQGESAGPSSEPQINAEEFAAEGACSGEEEAARDMGMYG